MHHFFVEAHQVENGSVRILGGDVNHMKNVLRMRAGEKVAVSDGAGQTYLCQVESFEEDAVCLKILEHQAADAELPSRLILFQCLPKGDKMDLIVQKAVELGVAGIVPVSSRRCVVKLDQKKEESKRKRWQAIAESAAKQSGRGVVPKVHPLCGFQEALKLAGELDVCLIPYECAEDLLGDGTERERFSPAFEEASRWGSLSVRRAVLKKTRWRRPVKRECSPLHWEKEF